METKPTYVVACNKGLVYFASPSFREALDYLGKLIKFDWKERDDSGARPDYYRIIDSEPSKHVLAVK